MFSVKITRAIHDEHFVLADFFDYISGTSTGAIIAAALSLGWSVDKIRDFYINSGEQMFDKASLLKRFASANTILSLSTAV
jgi:patatin-like phospholipase/acyl hydrolase